MEVAKALRLCGCSGSGSGWWGKKAIGHPPQPPAAGRWTLDSRETRPWDFPKSAADVSGCCVPVLQIPEFRQKLLSKHDAHTAHSRSSHGALARIQAK
jgi:hypothetical protein